MSHKTKEHNGGASMIGPLSQRALDTMVYIILRGIHNRESYSEAITDEIDLFNDKFESAPKEESDYVTASIEEEIREGTYLDNPSFLQNIDYFFESHCMSTTKLYSIIASAALMTSRKES